MDNFQLSATAKSVDSLHVLLEVIIRHVGIKGATHFVSGPGVLALYWSDPKVPDSQKFLMPMYAASLATLVDSWLKAQEYGEEPGIDGSVSKGFHIESGNESGWSYCLARIKPVWAHHHK